MNLHIGGPVEMASEWETDAEIQDVFLAWNNENAAEGCVIEAWATSANHHDFGTHCVSHQHVCY